MTASEKGHRDLLASIGKAIRLRRVELDMKRSELAERAGLSYAYVAEIENGTKQASSKALWVLAKALGLEPHELMASAARLETPERAPALASPLRRMGVSEVRSAEPAEPAALAALGEARRVSWFHLPASEATQGSRAGAPSAAAFADDAGAPPGPSDPPGLPDILARVEAALEGLPDERAELALMLALDERRTRRIVREELSRQRLGR